MDKKLLIPLLALTVSGCLNDMEYTAKNAEPMLVMNSLLNAGDGTHEVWLGVSKPGCVDSLTGAVSVQCFINGSLAATAAEQPGENRLRRFTFPASFNPGDKVRIEISAGSFNASATVGVPSPPVLESVDTLTVGDPESPDLAFRIGLTDKTPGADYYSLRIYSISQIDLFWEDALVESTVFVRLCNLDTGEDLILSEDNIAAANMDDVFDVGTPNRYGAFFDSQFDCRSVTLRPKVSRWELDSWYLPTFTAYDSTYVRPSLRVELSHIDGRYYYYLKALNSLENGTSDLALEETAIPCNVEGGMGFVGIANTVSRSFTLPEYSSLNSYDDDPVYE